LRSAIGDVAINGVSGDEIAGAIAATLDKLTAALPPHRGAPS
jgi:hypothetical protein